MQLGNKVFIDAVTKELAAKQYQQILLMVGDTRQSNMLDTLHHGSFPQQGNGFVALCTLGTILSETLKSSNTDVKVDGYLLADTLATNRLALASKNTFILTPPVITTLRG